jgi:predicted ATPase/DNA-binding SARP family transcriptional activator
VRVDVLGAVGVVGSTGSLSGRALGGRRARVVLVALALAERPVAADRLAATLWGDDPPPTWQVALRGVVRGLRGSLEVIGAGDEKLIVTTPSGYGLAPGVAVDVRAAADALRRADAMLGDGRRRGALEEVLPVTALDGAQLLPDEDADWVTPHRQALALLRLRAVEIVVAAAGALGEHHLAIEAAQVAVAANPLDERAHRALISAASRAGDRAGAVRAYEQCRSILADQLGIDPSTETVAMYLSALSGQAASSPARFPTASSAFFGRQAETAELADALGSPGLVVVSGRGGVGKSRLLQHVASTMSDVPGGRLWVSLTPVSADALVASTVALEVGVTIGTDDPVSGLADHLAPLGRVLLALDGCEAVVDGVASLATALLAACPMLTLVVTSRIPLAVGGERVVRVQPLPEPESGTAAALLDNTQVHLLLDRVRDGGGELTIDDQIGPYVGALCRRCGGLPLALELVAAQLTAIPAGDLLDHLPDLVPGEDDQLRGIARASYALLDVDEAAVFRRFAVLDGPVGLHLAAKVVAGSDVEPFRVVRILRELTARGLLGVDRGGPRWRYQQDDDLHRFALELLIEHQEETTTLERLADVLVAMLPEDARAAPTSFQGAVTEVLAAVRSLLTASLEGRVSRDRGLELAFRLHRYWAGTSVGEGRFWLARLLADDSDSAWTGHATYALGYLSYWAGDAEVAVGELERSASMLRGVDDSYSARALIYLGGLADDLDRGPQAIEYVQQAMVAAAPYGVDLQVAASMGMGCVLAERVDPKAVAYAADAIALCRRGGSAEQLAAAMPTAAMVCWQVGEYDQARAYISEARPMHADIRRIARVVLFSAAACLAFAEGDLEEALEIGTTADLEASELAVEREVPLIRCVLARAELALGHVESAKSWTLGALDSAGKLAFGFPRAICLETAAVVAVAAESQDRASLAKLLGFAARIRANGDRPCPPALRGGVDMVRLDLGVDLDLEDFAVPSGTVDGAAAELAASVLASTVPVGKRP